MNTRKFREVYSDVSDFLTDYSSMGIPTTISTANATTLFYLLYARFANSHFANEDEIQSKLKIFSTIFQYGPAWESRLAIQTAVRGLELADLKVGSKQITNHAFHPNQEPSTGDLEELEYIDEQHSAGYKKSDIDAYASQWNMISTDVTEEFLNKFKKIFTFIVTERDEYLYEGDEY